MYPDDSGIERIHPKKELAVLTLSPLFNFSFIILTFYPCLCRGRDSLAIEIAVDFGLSIADCLVYGWLYGMRTVRHFKKKNSAGRLELKYNKKRAVCPSPLFHFKFLILTFSLYLYRGRDSNPRPTDYDSDALTD